MAETPSRHVGRRGEDGMGKIQMYLVVLLVAASAIGVGIYFGSGSAEDREELQGQLNDRYVEQVDLSTSNTPSRATIVKIDGEARADCEANDDGTLECAEGPQPTVEDSAE